MVKKLFKHEFIYYLRTLLPVYILTLLVATLGRVVQFFENDSTSYIILFAGSLIVFFVAIMACFLLTTVFSVVRFYKNLFSSEGYLSFTLPVTPTAHLSVKLISATVCQATSLIIVLVSSLIVMSGDVFTEVIAAVKYLLNMLSDKIAYTHISLFIVEFIVLLILGIISEFLLFYLCIAIGQLFNKNRIFAAVGAYFCFYFISQAFATVISILSTVVFSNMPEDVILNLISKNPIVFFHSLLCGLLLFSAIINLVFFIVIRFIMTKRLNLE